MEGCDLNLQKIHDIYQPKIFRYLSNLIDDYEAEDLTQEVFERSMGSGLDTLISDVILSSPDPIDYPSTITKNEHF
ncbi:MAG: hypothetical protein WCG31_05345 [Deltaproteobacteria bacterium]